nr:ABC transporter substrate-binding protein [Microbacterium lemovicicum]
MFRHTRKAVALVGVAVAALALAGCAGQTGAAAPSASDAAQTEGFPLTITHMYGETTLDAPPQRIATWGWGATDAVLALGIQPVAIPSAEYGGGDDLIVPWVKTAIDEVGGEAPVLLDNSTYELSVEELLATDADVLIAPYSGLTQDEYDAVTAAGIPVIAPEKALWSTPWRDVVTITGEVLGRETDAATVLDGIDKEVSDAAAANPEFAGTTVAFVTATPDEVDVYLPVDARVEILEDLGFVSAPSVTELDTGASTFYTAISPENLDKLDAQVVFTFVQSEDELQTFLTSERTRLIPAIAKGAVGAVVGTEDASAVSPTALSLPYILPKFVEQLQTATATAKS